MRRRAPPALGIPLKYALTAIIAVALAASTLADAERANAHGGGFRLTMRESAGPYALTLGMIPDPPLVGEATLILEVADADSGERLPNARVVATLDPPQDSGIAPISLAFGPDSYDPTLYEANAQQDATGEWTLAVEVSGGRGEGGAAFRYEVRRANPIAGLITLATLLALVTVLGLSMRAFLKQRGGSRRAKRRGKA